MSTQYRLVQSGKTASGGCSAGQGSSEPVVPRIYLFLFFIYHYGELVNLIDYTECLKILSHLRPFPVRKVV
jgi:hypothetical protein